ncbi:MAG: HesB/YadR/YfhF-family protein [Solirubrobacterales bacterium]
MLEISSQAEEAIRGILASEGVPDGATFRISAQQGPEAASSLAVSITEEAPPEDQVVEGDDVEVRLEPAAAEILDDKQLDATVADGEVQFSLSAQAA